MNRTLRFVIATLVALGAAATASAASRDEQTHACRSDAFHFCAAEIPNVQKITACMKRHLDELSPACRAMFGDGKNGNNNGNVDSNGNKRGARNGTPDGATTGGQDSNKAGGQ
jgi:hypothetical protein